ncbi:PREDICTED: protein TIC 22-like, chloroplastic isoform X1 [Erythranthe guttata]|uniref:protein TIC 22-like, chloroplastic isoform X1 n=1 Tax=Erythranthe guttata TaxID=4155 RepID=UPI00064DB52B|nr:PREDICTED: protein TIC 22-like, chloroplastic isoform X1 [Erythranthe guttata]|eukprot:XP_012839132.1 PREDICTED: protein TIC 22-like, chloroplastic isoform X1 [Erythranthe guttata]
MNFFELKQSYEENPLHHVFSNLHFLRIPNPNPNPNPNPFSSKLPSQERTVDQLDNMKIDSSSSSSNLSVIKERLKEVPVYRLKSNRRLSLVRSHVTDRRAGLFFFSEADAQDSAADYNTVEFNRKRGGLQTLKVPLAEIIELEELGFNKAMPSICHWFVAEFLPMYAPAMVNRFVEDKVADPHVYIRLVPDISEVKNALQERKKAGFHGDTFTGVPVFQSDALKVRVDGSPNNLSHAFFRKADLENALRGKKQTDHIDEKSDIIQVTALEDIIQEMKDCSTSKWNNVILVPPGGKSS